MNSLVPARTRRCGFTLVELMIACAVVGILATVAVPGFIDQVRKARRAEAFALLGSAQLAQERRRSVAPSYTDDLTHTGLNIAPPGKDSLYEFSVDHAGARGYTLTATARAGTTQAGDGPCARLRVRVSGGFVFHGSAPLGSETFDESSANRCWGR